MSAQKAALAKAVVVKARRKKREMALSVITGREIDLGRNGSKWKHGWIPLNPAAVALKAHHSRGGTGVDNPAEHMGKIREHVMEATREAASRREGIAAHTEMHVGPNGKGRIRAEKKIDAHGTHMKYNVQTNENAGMHKSYDDPEKAAVALHRHLYGAPKDNSEKTAWRAGAPAGGVGSKDPDEHAKIIHRHVVSARSELNARSAPGDSARETPTHVGPAGRGSVTVESKGGKLRYHAKFTPQTDLGLGDQEMTTHNNSSVAALMLHNRIYGKPSFGSTGQIREGNPATRTTGTGGKKATELSPLTKNVKTLGDVQMVAKMHGKDSPEFKRAVAEFQRQFKRQRRKKGV